MKKILIIGLGLIGGSFARALRQHKIAGQIFAFDNDIEAISNAKQAKIIDDFYVLDKNLQDFDLIVIATPLSFYPEIIEKISNNLLSQHPIIIDLGSLKEFVIKTLPLNLKNNFIACHPIAGSDKTGFNDSLAELFNGKKFIICKTRNNSQQIVKIIENIVIKIGANPDFIDAKLHDEIYALVSHLPQFLSFLTKDFSPKKQDNQVLQSAFRLDNSSFELWNDIFKLNQKNIEKFYLEFFTNFENFITKIVNQKYDEVADEINKIAFSKHSLQNLQQKKFGNNKERSKIIFRLIVVASYLKIKQISNLQTFAGSGFKDFTSIISYVELQSDLALFLKEARKEILFFAKEIGFEK